MQIPEGFTKAVSSAVAAWKVGPIAEAFTLDVAKVGIETATQRTCELQIIFPSGQRCHYANVPLKLVDEFAKAESKGKFMHSVIKTQFKDFYYAELESGEPLLVK